MAFRGSYYLNRWTSSEVVQTKKLEFNISLQFLLEVIYGLVLGILALIGCWPFNGRNVTVGALALVGIIILASILHAMRQGMGFAFESVGTAVLDLVLGGLLLVPAGPFQQRDVVVGSILVSVGCITAITSVPWWLMICRGLSSAGCENFLAFLGVVPRMAQHAVFIVLGTYMLLPVNASWLHPHNLAAGTIMVVTSSLCILMWLCVMVMATRLTAHARALWRRDFR